MLLASSSPRLALVAAAAMAALGFGCSSSSDSPSGAGAGPTSTTSPASSTQATGVGGSTSAGGGGSSACGDDPMLPEQVLDDTSDPEHGLFTLDQALDGLPDGPGPLRAIITTELGVLTCALQTNVTSASGHGALGAPNSVANFVGLARGKRAFYDATMGKWVRRRFYDGLTWHRVIPQFVAQGGDPAGNGTGGPGYTIDFEITSLRNVPGALAYASTAPMSNTAGSQFYVVAEVPQPSLDRDYAVFGLCDPVSVVTALTRVPRDSNDEPLTPIHMTTIAVTRCAP